MKTRSSPYTKLFWDEYQLNPLRNDYNIIFDQHIVGYLNIEKLKSALFSLIENHILLNSHLIEVVDELYWQINADINELEVFNNDDKQKEFVTKHFNLEVGPLYRFGLFQLSENEYDLILVFHNALICNISFDSLITEISDNYNNTDSKKKFNDTITSSLHLTKQIINHNNEFNENLDYLRKNQANEFWQQALQFCESKVELPYQQTLKTGVCEYRFSLENNPINKEKLLELKIDLFSYLISCYGYLLSRYTNSYNIHIAYPIVIKRNCDLNDVAQINTVVLPVRIDDAESIKTLINKTNLHINSYRLANEHSYAYFPISEIIANSPIKQLNVAFAQGNLTDKEFDFAGCHITINKRYNINIAGSELLLEYEEKNQYIEFSCRYNKKLFTEEFIVQFCNHYQNVIHTLIQEQNYNQQLAKIQLLTKEEYQKIVYDWNNTDKDYLQGQTIHQLFEEQAQKTPDNIAVVFEKQCLTYNELNKRANQLAHSIRSTYRCQTDQDLSPDTIIALCVERELEMIIAILAILKSGGAYLTLDSEYPEERISYILENAKPVMVLTQNLHLNWLNQITTVTIMNISDYDRYQLESEITPPVELKSKNLAYVIYTSGTTGRPKGVMIEHGSVINLIKAQQCRLGIKANSKILQYASSVFDASAWEVFSSILNGATIYLINRQSQLDPIFLHDYIKNNKIDVALIPPIMLDNISNENLATFSTLVTGGDLCSGAVLDKWLLDDRLLINAYGPTESTVCATMHKYVSGGLNTNIGKPLNNIKVYVLDCVYNPVPVGVVGELYIAGAGIARGYLNNFELTAERFIPNIFATESDIAKGYTRMYKTGDLVRWLSDGNLEYIGRNDFQIKIHGYRVELGEVEVQLSQLDGIKESVVLAKESVDTQDQYLVGYYIPEKLNTLNQVELLNRLSRVLPHYMIPSILVELDHLPITISGKLDRKALPDAKFVVKDNYVAPITKLESTLCMIFAEVLGLDVANISTTANFFKMGGNSILSIKLKQKLNQVEEFKGTTVADIYTYNNIKGLINKVNLLGANYNLPKLISSNSHEIAIIATSGVFTANNTVDQLWELLESNSDAMELLNIEECRKLGVPEKLLTDSNYVPVFSHIKNIDLFDPGFWGMSPNQARQLDPQIRKFVEHCWYVLEQSGYSQSRKQDVIGVFAGTGSNIPYFYENILNGDLDSGINIWEANALNLKDALATKVAYLLGLSGPAYSINTACSTGLVSIANACDNLILGKCNIALAGGVSLALPEQTGYLYENGMILSPDGKCRVFDDNANGTIMSSGVGVVLLKRLEDAIKDKDNILGVIKGYATNNDGDRKSGYTVPSVLGQSECVILAQKTAGINVNDIDYIECHGTATKLGDPIEVQALEEAFKYNGYSNKDKKVILGSMKANIGHADAVAGIAGLIKITEMFKHNLIPGQPNFNKPNLEFNLDSRPFEIARNNSKWLSKKGEPRLAGVSSFGVGGTNAHVVVSDYHQKAKPVISTDNKEYIIPISAKNRKSLLDYQKILATYLEDKEISLRDLAYTLTYRREHFNCRSGFVVSAKSELIEQLNTKTNFSELIQQESNTLVFMFPGQGNQYSQMTKELYDNDRIFRQIIDDIIEIANKHLQQDLTEILFSNTSKVDIDQTQWSQICLFVIEYGLAKYLYTLNIKPKAYIGHSLGEYIAATLSGVFTLDQAIKLIVARGKCMQIMPEGAMLSINTAHEEIRNYIKQSNCEISLINSMEDIVVSGDKNDIDNLYILLKNKGIASIKLNTSHAYHSRSMQVASENFKEFFKDIQINKPQQVTISNISGEISGEEITSPEYWQKHITSTVEFAKGIKTLANEYSNKVTFIEVGLGSSLTSFVNKHKKYINSKTIHTVQLMPSKKQRLEWDIKSRQQIEAILWQNGLYNEINKDVKDKSNLITNLPTYQFNFKSCWINKKKHKIDSGVIEVLKTRIASLESIDSNTIVSITNIINEVFQDTIKSSDVGVNNVNIIVLEQSCSEIEKQVATIMGSLLGVNEISINDNFFDLGGNSIQAINLVRLLSMSFNTDIDIKDIFIQNTPSLISNLILQSSTPFKYRDYCIQTNKVNKYEPFNLSNIQQAYLFGRYSEFNMGNTSTHSYQEMIFSDFDLLKFEKALNMLIQRHDSLRIIFQDNQQIILEKTPFYKIKNYSEIDKNQLDHIREIFSHKIYKTDEWPLFDFELSYFNQQYILHISIDLLIFDGTSINIFFEELAQLYNSSNIFNVKLPELDLSFRDYIIALEKVKASDLFTLSKKYWEAKLIDYNFNLNLPFKSLPSRIKEPIFARVSTQINRDIWGKFKEKSKKYNIGLTSAILYIYGYVLTRYNNSESICINLTLFNRLPIHNQVNSILGNFTVLELFNFDRNFLIGNLNEDISAIHQTLWNDIEHNLFDGIDFQRLIRKELALPETEPIAPIILTSMVGNSSTINLNNYIKDGYSISQTSQAYLNNKAYETLDGFVAEWDYVEQLFDSEIVSSMHKIYCDLIEYLAIHDWECKLPEIKLSSLDESVIMQSNSHVQSDVNYTLVDLFMNSLKSNPLDLALVDAYGEYSYNTIFEYSSAISLYLHDYNLCKSTKLICILSEKGYKQVVAALGIMQTGLAYLPLSVDWPKGRCIEILSEAKVDTILLSKSQFNNCIKGSNIENDYNWLIIEEIINYKSNTKLEELYKPSLDDVAYVIFTSGSTGKPKGVTISHKGVVNTILAINQRFEVNSKDKILALSELSFDLSVYDIFGLLAAGGTIVFPDHNKVKEPNHWYQLIDKHNITIWNTVPQLMHLLVDYVKDSNKQLTSLRVTLMSGDWIPLNLPKQIKEVCPNITIMSLGGATEASIWSIWYEIKQINSDWKSIPYGQAMPNQKMYVLNEQRQHNPIGVIGEIYIGGQGVALGYWQDEHKTNASFIVHPQLGRLYKTGDLGKWDKDGYMVFEGRRDGQVKLNGYRVELDEISSRLSKLPKVENALVTIQGNKLVGYLVSEIEQNNEEIISYLNSYLPQYMIPEIYITIKYLPVTINGKIDYRQLPKAKVLNQEIYVAPTTKLEKHLCEIWQEILNLKQVGITDNFFRVGGNSLLAIKLIYRVNSLYDKGLTVADIFISKTIKQLILKFNDNGKTFNVEKPFMEENNKPRLFFIHPGVGGCEYYQQMAEYLKNDFYCIGIDNFNIFSNKKISDLNKLANYYINNSPLLLQSINNQESIKLVGFSMGGIISLEIASILEEKGIKNIKIIILDSFIPDDFTKSINVIEGHCSYMEIYYEEKGYEKSYVQSAINAYRYAEHNIMNQTLSKKLNHSDIILYKATKTELGKIANYPDLKLYYSYVTNVQRSNIDQCSSKKIDVFNLHSTHATIYSDILDSWSNYYSSFIKFLNSTT